MKELSIEEKARAYDKVRNKIAIRFGSNVAKEIFSEYEEGKDERIRKEIIDYLSTVDDKELIPYESWIAWLEKQGEQKQPKELTNSEFVEKCKGLSRLEQHILALVPTRPIDAIKVDARTIRYLVEQEQKPADKVEPKFKVKYAGCEYNVLEVKDIAGVTFYGIEDEPNHIDYVKADNCEIISGDYGIKENGSPYPIKPAVFSEQKPAWSEEDEERLQSCLNILQAKGLMGATDTINTKWLKSLKDRCFMQWKPTKEQMGSLLYFSNQSPVLAGLYEDLKKLK